ncbi:olfactory receptor 14J1-like [Alligator sinensis]|uniref:Olfactory receptor n=1 Tax=Alligator sinensis TaxID=38654 RepID=A0A1U8DMI3_ALLSI|nr:olfactory receptor 14J1-like [Alligator sinensis]
MSNCTTVTEFLLLGFSDALELQILHLASFLILYLAALIGNLLVIVLIAFDSHLHTPMYFFLLNLSILDIGSISVTVPKSMANSILNTRLISYSGCVTQVFFVVFFIAADIAILTFMAYDRYIAICKPLHYATASQKALWMMTSNCTAVTEFLLLGFSDALGLHILHLATFLTIYLAALIGNLLVITVIAVDSHLHTPMYFFFLNLSILDIGSISVIVPKSMANSILNTSTDVIAYVKPTPGSPSALDLMVSVLYSVIPPMMNPVIYSMRNKDIKASLWNCTDVIAYVKPTPGSPSALDLMVSVLYSVIPPMMNPVIYSMRNKDIKASLWNW